MFCQSATRLYSSFGQQRKLFLLVFLWTCLCLLIFRSSLFSGGNGGSASQLPDSFGAGDESSQVSGAERQLPAAQRWQARSSAAPLYLAPEFALPDNGNAFYYSLSSMSSINSAKPFAWTQQISSQLPSSAPTNLAEEDRVSSEKKQSPANININKPSNHQQQAKSHAAKSKSSEQVASRSSSSGKSANSNEFIAGSQCKYDYPSLFDLQFNNIHWQKMTTKPLVSAEAANVTSNNLNATTSSPANYYLYNAYYDDRWRAGLPSVRILAMIDRIQPPATNCLFWSTHLRSAESTDEHSSGSPESGRQHSPKLVPLVTRASFVYAWYPKWGNYKDGLLQPWIVTCPMPRAHVGLVPDSVSLVEVPPELVTAPKSAGGASDSEGREADEARNKRDASSLASDQQQQQQQQPASIAMPPSFSSSSPAGASQSVSGSSASAGPTQTQSALETPALEFDCKRTLPITNNLPVYNQRPAVKEKFAVCVKGLDFPHEDVSVRLVEWIELLNLLGAGKIFLYNLDVHENISRVLHYYQKRGIVELSPLTLPGDQPNLPEYQHLYLKSKLTAKRQNELIPYNDCLYRNLNSYQYLALLDIDEIIMPLKNHHNWYDLMQEVETLSLSEQNYSRASYNVRNVYFFDDLAGPLGTSSSSSSTASSSMISSDEESASDQDSEDVEEDKVKEGERDKSERAQQATDGQGESLERGIPHYLHMMQHVYRSKNYTKPGQYVKCFHNTERVVSLHNHFPMNCFGQCTTYSIPVHLAHLQHYRKDCVGPLKQSCKNDFRVFTQRDTTIWKYKQQMIRRTTRVLNHLGLLTPAPH